MSLTLRSLRPDDHAAVGRIIRAAYRQAGPMSGPYLDWVASPSRWVDGVTDVFVAADDHDRPVGAVAFTLPGDPEFEGGGHPPAGDAGFRFLAVAPAAQGRGAGAALVDACLEAARARGCRRLVIHSMSFMTAAHALYARRGFVRRPDLDVAFPGGAGYAFTCDLATDAAEHFPAPGAPRDPLPWFEDAWAPR